MKKLALIYWPKGGRVENVAGIVKDNITGFDVTMICAEDMYVSDLVHFDSFVFGGSTVGADHWGNKESENKWAVFFTDLEKKQINLKGKKGALYGLGNQVLYPDHFVDDMIYMKRKLEAAGLELIGEVSSEGYDHNESESEVDGNFVGLALDEDSQPELTLKRIQAWLSVIELEL